MAGDAGAASSPPATPCTRPGGPRARRLQRLRGERLERPNAHLYETGRLRRVHLRGHANIRKRLLVHACGLNLRLLMRRLTGVGTPRSLQDRARALFDAMERALRPFWSLVLRPGGVDRWIRPKLGPRRRVINICHSRYKEAVSHGR